MRIQEENILSRESSPNFSPVGAHGLKPVTGRAPAQTRAQSQIDALVSSFIHQASDWKSVAAMTAGALAYRWGKLSVLNVGAIRESPLLARPLSITFSLTTEVTAFEFTNRTLQTFSTSSQVHQSTSSPSLWSWSGPGGWKEGWLGSFVAFGTLKGFGKLSQGQNLILQHGFQDTGMVLGHQLVSLAGIGLKPEGTFAEQFVHAEATNIQIGAGMALGHHLVPGIHGFERGLDLVLQAGGVGAKHSGLPSEGRNALPLRVAWNTLFPQLAMVESTVSGSRHPSSPDSPLKPTILLMSSEPPQGGGDSPNAIYRLSAPNPYAQGLETLKQMESLRENFFNSQPSPSLFKSWRALRHYRALLKNLPEGHPLIYEEARALREGWGAEPQTALSGKTIRSLPFYQSLIEKFGPGDTEVYKEAWAFRETFVWFNHIHETYDLFIPKFKSLDPEFHDEIAALKKLYFTGYGSWWKMESYLLAMGLFNRGDPKIYEEAQLFRETDLKKNRDWRIGPVYRWLLQRFEGGSPKNWEEAIHLRDLFHHQEPKVRREAFKSYRVLIPSLAQGDNLIREEIRAIEQYLPRLSSKEKKEAVKILKELKKQGERRATFLLIP